MAKCRFFFIFNIGSNGKSWWEKHQTGEIQRTMGDSLRDSRAPRPHIELREANQFLPLQQNGTRVLNKWAEPHHRGCYQNPRIEDAPSSPLLIPTVLDHSGYKKQVINTQLSALLWLGWRQIYVNVVERNSCLTLEPTGPESTSMNTKGNNRPTRHKTEMATEGRCTSTSLPHRIT